jgi:uncharacterized metal-binding protein YceD (DUF177 family)
MNTRLQEALLYRDLARQQARISRQIGLEALVRLQSLVAEPEPENAAPSESGDHQAVTSRNPEFEVMLDFSMGPAGFCRVDGTVEGRLILKCNGCAEVLPHDLSLSFGCLIVETEAIADDLREGEAVLPVDVLVANGQEVSLAQIIEDEILLSLPERLCVSEPCERAPELEYPAVGGEAGQAEKSAADAARDDDNPFSVLRGLKSEKSTQK